MKYLAHIFIVFCFFPYLDFLGLGTDTQPNALLIAPFLLLGIKDKKVNAPIVLFWVVFILSLFLFFYNSLSLFVFLKNVLNYLSIPLVCTAMYALMTKMNYQLSFKFFLWIVGLYGAIGLIQLYVNPTVIDFMLNMQRGALLGGRGVSSISTEPAYYGTTCLFFMIFSLLSFNKQQNLIAVPILIFQLTFLSRSATAIGILVAALLLFTVVQVLRFKMRYIIATAVSLMIAVPIFINTWNQIEETRVGQLAEEFVKNPLLIAKFDGSVAVRLTSAIAPFMALSHDYAKPRGLGNYQDFLSDFYTRGQYRSFLSLHAIKDKPRLGGSMNMVVFQLGFLGLLFPIAVFLSFKKALSSDAIKFCFILLVLIMFTQIQMMHGMFGVILATAIHQGNTKNTQPLNNI